MSHKKEHQIRAMGTCKASSQRCNACKRREEFAYADELMASSQGTSDYTKATQIVCEQLQGRLCFRIGCWIRARPRMRAWNAGRLKSAYRVRKPRKGESSETGDSETPGEANATGVVKDGWARHLREGRGKRSQELYLNTELGLPSRAPCVQASWGGGSACPTGVSVHQGPLQDICLSVG